MTKYNFYTGKNAKKITYKGYKYLGKGKLGKLKIEKIDGKCFYYLVEFFNDYLRISPKTAKISKFKEATQDDWKYLKDNSEYNYVEKQTPKKELIFKTKITTNEKRLFRNSPEILLGKEDINFWKIKDSNIIRSLQLKEGDELIVTIQKKVPRRSPTKRWRF